MPTLTDIAHLPLQAAQSKMTQVFSMQNHPETESGKYHRAGGWALETKIYYFIFHLVTFCD
jgi:hypothetical protein